jgi:hypothetical protein
MTLWELLALEKALARLSRARPIHVDAANTNLAKCFASP